METASDRSFVFSSAEFKSYYVVWKQKPISTQEERDDRFKSYYVVWKRYFEGDGEGRADVFKSYYVVWKPFLQKKAVAMHAGLNRTM